MATVTNSKSHVNKWKSGAAPTKIGRHTIHPSFETEHRETQHLHVHISQFVIHVQKPMTSSA
ncbi:unnamed protein product [Brassica oleracea var. botrytis]